MKFPIEIERLINSYSKPMTKPDWRKGSYIYINNNTIKNHIKCISGGYHNNISLNEMMMSMGHIYTDKLIPDGRKKFDEDQFISAYEAFYLDFKEWE